MSSREEGVGGREGMGGRGWVEGVGPTREDRGVGETPKLLSSQKSWRGRPGRGPRGVRPRWDSEELWVDDGVRSYMNVTPAPEVPPDRPGQEGRLSLSGSTNEQGRGRSRGGRYSRRCVRGPPQKVSTCEE